MEVALVIFVIAVIFISRSIKVVPQQNAWVVERLGKFHATLTPGLNFLVPFRGQGRLQAQPERESRSMYPARSASRATTRSCRSTASCTFQVTDPMRASYGSSNYIVAVTQLAQTSLR
jgi:regulator of protease activity HflC (stomatin/prohibitin superfamily)